MAEKITRREHIFKGRVIALDLLDVTLPDGGESKREVVIHPGAVGIVALDDDDNVILVRQYRIAAGREMLEIPAGTLEPDEAPIICAERELQEEAGYKPLNLEAIGGMYVAPGYTTEFIHLFLARNLVVSDLPGDDDEFIDVVTMPLAEVLRLIDSSEIQDGKTICGVCRVARLLGY